MHGNLSYLTLLSTLLRQNHNNTDNIYTGQSDLIGIIFTKLCISYTQVLLEPKSNEYFKICASRIIIIASYYRQLSAFSFNENKKI